LQSNDSQSLSKVSGVIQNSTVVFHKSKKSGGAYHAEIMYNYFVKNQIYSNNKVAFGDYGSSNPQHARSISNLYQKGKEVTVYYQPEDPQNSVLEPGFQTQALIMPVIGFVFFVAGVLMFVFIPKGFGGRVNT